MSKTGKQENSRKIDQKNDRDAKRRKAESLRKQARHVCLLTFDLVSLGYDSLPTLS